jgi:hypothetical protein
MATLNEQFRRMQMLAGIITEEQYKTILNEDNTLENKIQQWVNDNAGGYGPDENDDNLNKFNEEMKILLNNTLEDFNPDYYGDDTTMSPDDILEDFIDGAIDIIGNYTMEYYGDDTSFSPGDIKDDFYEFIGVEEQLKEAYNPFLDTNEGGYMREEIDSVSEEQELDLNYRNEFDIAFEEALSRLKKDQPQLDFEAIKANKESFF